MHACLQDGRHKNVQTCCRYLSIGAYTTSSSAVGALSVLHDCPGQRLGVHWHMHLDTRQHDVPCCCPDSACCNVSCCRVGESIWDTAWYVGVKGGLVSTAIQTSDVGVVINAVNTRTEHQVSHQKYHAKQPSKLPTKYMFQQNTAQPVVDVAWNLQYWGCTFVNKQALSEPAVSTGM